MVALFVAWHHPYKHYSESEKIILIPRGTPSAEVAGRLEGEGIVMHRTLFLAYLKIWRRSSHLQAGEYRFQGPLTIPQIADKIIRGLVYYHEVTITEGLSLSEISELLEQKGFVRRNEFWPAVRRVNLLAGLAQPQNDLEGFLFPDTYRLTRGETANEIVQAMIERFKQIYETRLKTDLDRQPMTLKEVVTLASLIEKETGGDDERPLVSAVFHNRLKKGMPLQCDPTVIYASRLQGDYRGEIYRSDLARDSPYNTYKHAGLPPGPIASPGLESLEAALKPADVEYLYFVSDNNGRHVFSKTLEEHNRAVTAYRRNLRLESRKMTDSKQGKL
jgi:peptidoglycan lytic transglycosylase G